MKPPHFRRTFCSVCGLEESAVEKLHYFPSIQDRSRLWQVNMNLVFVGDIPRHSRICNNHFTEEQYLNRTNWRLLRDAIPTLLPYQIHKNKTSTSTDETYPATSAIHPQFEMMDLIQPGTSRTNQHATKYEVTVQTQAPELSTSKILFPKNKKSVFRKIENITQSPRKIKLISLVKSKESQTRQLKKLCRKRKNDIKSLTSLDDNAVVRNLFAGMSQTTSDFLISQLRCAKKSPRGPRWTVEEKAMALALYRVGKRKRNTSHFGLLKF
ncbi:hypothetical protein ABEB36_014407 [Hypothenemus hampei]|uniref:THAP-type domain-containing protein n=2 Tax=Hypothenemus hampei TaxID=57062 RepID=A0ABD1E1P3_HYPHA